MYEKKSHGVWLSLLEVSGPFLAEGVLEAHFPQGLDELDPQKKKLLRQAYDEWREAQDGDDPQFAELHQAWIDLVLKQGLELDEDDDADVLKSTNLLGADIKLELPEHDVTIRPDFAVVAAEGELPSLLIKTLPAGADLEAVSKTDSWAASPVERMVQLCRATKVRLGLLTNGERWMLIDAPEGGVTTYASWYARLWGQEPITLQAFVNLLGIRRFFLDPSQQLPALLDESLKHQDEVTDALGDQVRRAVEVLVQALDRADQDRGRELLRDVEPAELYEAGLTVMMRLVFLLSAEERDLLLLGDERYEAHYAVSTLRMQLREQAGLHSEEILSHRRDAWSRLLAIFRAVYGGVEHEKLRMPALGGSLFDPDRFPFLEGRAKGSDWRHDPAQPLPIDNRTVLLLLDAIQLFQGRTLSYRALDVEQIGYVYEGLLERTVIRAEDVTLELDATQKSKKPWLTWGELEDAHLNGDKAVAKLLQERTGSSASRVKNDLAKTVTDVDKDRLLTVCHGDQELRDRLAPYYHFMRIDPWGYPLIYPKDAFMVATGSDRRETGTHYTPKTLTESIVKETLEPLVYVGPAEGRERKDWELKSPAELLDLKICDLAMGSGAFLVQVCRWLSERLLEAWAQTEAQGSSVTVDGLVVDQLNAQEPLTQDAEQRSVTARRLISERCLYGVDFNPLAVELAKLSIWLVTLAKGRPFGFLDHNLRHGDSLLGITNLDQLHYLNMQPSKISEGGGVSRQLFSDKVEGAVKEAIELRMALRQRQILDIHDVEVMAHLDQQARDKLELPELVADGLVGETLKGAGKKSDVAILAIEAGKAFEGEKDAVEVLRRRARAALNDGLPNAKQARKAFHWCLEFPEVFLGDKHGFDAIVGNPPFLGGQKITGAMGDSYRDYLVETIANGKRGSADLVAYFFIRAKSIIAREGFFGLIAVNTISEGNTREVGLDSVLETGSVIYRANPNVDWKGEANVVTSSVFFSASKWLGAKHIGVRRVNNISSALTQRENWKPVKLKQSSGLVFQGAIILGDGFIVDNETYADWMGRGDESCEVVFDYLIGREVNQSPTHNPGRKVISFFDWSERKAKNYGSAYDYVVANVKGEREKGKDKGARENWWRYLRPRPELFHLIGRGHDFERHPKNWDKNQPPLDRVLVFATGATKYPCFTFVPNTYIYANTLCVVASQSYALFSCLSSDLHAIWAWEHGSRMKQDLRYTHGDIFETFPFPDGVLSDTHVRLSELGEKFFEIRSQYMKSNDKGMTKFYNDLHNPALQSEELKTLRAVQAEINSAVLEAYGFDDIDLEHGFDSVGYLPEGKNIRFTISELAREELLYRLAMLNKERHEMESSAKAKVGRVVSIKKYEKKTLGGDDLREVAEPKPQLDIFGRGDE
ncbi:DNA methyltransferase [Microbulbifer sp. HZ11]|uniref:Eco57I restriction-modification methylase domain-containing protein n=1 Tax=Microbulbifer sp. HZ11 TaxID=1453501 RepID=UPI0009DEA32B|nr:DNA methyltransferase [Microbulbifer sp. HZ11]